MNKRSCNTFCYIKKSPEDKEKGMETERKKYIFFWKKKKTKKQKKQQKKPTATNRKWAKKCQQLPHVP